MIDLKIFFKKIISTSMLASLALFLVSFTNQIFVPANNYNSSNSFNPINFESNFVNPAMTSSGVTISGESPFNEGGGSYSFTGNSSYIEFLQNSNWNLGTSNFTVEWFQKQTDNNSWPRVFQIGNYPASFGVSLEGGAFYGWLSGANYLGNLGTYKNSWIHFAMVRDGTTIRAYKNGVLLGSTTISSSLNVGNSTTALTIGNELSKTVGSSFGGFITNLRLVSGVAVYTGTNTSTANFTVPNKNLTAVSVENPYGGSNTASVPSGATKLLLTPGVKNWSSTSNPFIGWLLPNGNTRFAIPSNGTTATFYYSHNGGTSWSLFGGSSTYVADKIIHNGVVYEGYTHSSDWSTGNLNYIHKAVLNGVDYISPGNETVSRNNNIYFYSTTRTITFDSRGGTAVTSITGEPGSTFTLPTNPTRTGYTFNNWFTDVALTTQLSTSSFPSSNITVYAKWDIESYTFAFDLNYSGKPSDPSSITAAFGSSITWPANPTRVGYNFGGWYTEPTLINSHANQNSMYDLGTNGTVLTLYAKWTPSNNTIVFNGNGSTSGTMANQTIATDATAPLSNNQFVKTGHTFNGWNTQADGSGTSYNNLANYTMGTSSTNNLYAQWTTNSYTITFNKNNGTGGSNTANPTYGVILPNATAPTRNGFVFGGYYTATNGGGTLYYDSLMQPQLNYNLTTDLTLYAKWTASITLAKPTLSSANSSTIFNFTDASTSYNLPIYENNEIVLTNAGAQASAFFFKDKIIQTDGFSTYFEIKQYKTSGTIPADGIVFVLAADTNSIGATGGGLGYSGISNSVAVVFDNYQNGSQPAPVFSTVYTNGNTASLWQSNQSIQYDTNLPSAYNSAATGSLVRTYKVWLNYNSQTQSLNFKIDVAGTITTYTFTNVPVPEEYYAGFTAATGGAQVKFAVPTWYFANRYYEDGINPSSTTESFVEDRSAPTSPSITLNKTNGTNSTLTISGSTDNVDGANLSYQYSFDGTTWLNYLGSETFDTSLNATVYARAYDGAGNISTVTSATSRFTLTFNSNSGTNVESLTEIPNASFTRPIDPTRAGYSFVNWYTDNTTYNNLFDFSNGITQDTTIYAKWQGLPYVITFDQQTGTGGSTTQTVTFGDALISATAPTKFGYNFTGYFTQVSGAGTQYYNSTMSSVRNWDITSDTTLYAAWSPKQVTITLNQSNGSGGTSSVLATFDAAMPSATAPSLAGHDFVGYFSQTNGQGTKYYDSSMASLLNWNLDSVTTLYAYYTPADYTITFNTNNGINLSFESKVVTYNQTYGELPTIERVGYNFIGWFNQSSGGTQILANSTVTIVDDEGFYAQWSPKTYTITFDKQLGSSGSDSATASYDNALPAATAPSRSGYTFNGYFTELNGEGTQYYSNAMASLINYSLLEGVTLYAKWTPNQYTITFDSFGGTIVGNNSKQVTFDEVYGELPTATRVGHTFAGWFTTQVAGFEILATDNVTAFSNQTLYARWNVNPYNINFITNGGANIDPISINYGANIVVPNATKAGGYEFVSWYPTLPATMPDQDLTVTAIYKRIIVENDFSVTNVNSNFKDGLIRFSLGVADPSARIFVDNEVNLASPGVNVNSGVISRNGTDLYYGTGSTLVKFGEVDQTLNGQNGNDLQVNINSTVLFPNGDFSSDYSNWTVNNGNYSITGDSGTGMTYQTTIVNQNGNKFARLYIYGTTNPYGTAHGPSITSAPFSAKPGDTISFKWKADANSDDYDVYAFLDNGGVRTQLLYSRGATQSSFITRELTLTEAMLPNGLTNNLKFIFVGGSYDRSGGRVVGATFYIDDVSIVDNGVNSTVINNLIRNVKYSGSSETQFVNIKTVDSTSSVNYYSFNNEAPVDSVVESSVALNGDFTFLEDTNFNIKLEFDRFFSDPSNITYSIIDPQNLNSGFTTINGTNLVGNGDNSRVGSNTIYVRASNGNFQSATIAYTINITNVNDNPALNPAYANFKIQIPYNQAFSYQLPTNFILDVDTGTTLTYTISGTLPPGITYNSSTRTFSGTFTGTSLPQIISITGSDGIASVTQTGIGFTSSVTVVFNSNGGSSVASQTIATSQNVVEPIAPTRTGYTFAGWFSDSNLTQSYNFSGIPNGLNLYAKWNINQYSITFDSNGGTVVNSITQNFDSNLTPPANPVKPGYTFIGWNPSLPSKIPATNLSTQAQWQINNYTIIFNSNYPNAPAISNINASYQADISANLPQTPTRTGYTFGGWHEDINLSSLYVLPNNMPMLGGNNASKTLFAKWNINQYTLTFDTAGGNIISSLTQDFDSNIIPITNPTRPGYIFDGWSPAIPSKVPAQNQTFTALWLSDDYTFRFNQNYQDSISMPDLTARYLEDITTLRPINPTRVGYTFDGWFEDAQLTTPYSIPEIMPILGSSSGAVKELFAKWTPVVYRVNYVGMLTSIGSNPVTYTIESNTLNLQTNFTQTGYNFLGFYDNPGFNGQPVTSIASGSIGDKTLYANWVKASFTLTFKDDKGGTLSSQSVAFETTIDTSFFPATSKEGYEFVGWSDNLPSVMPASNVDVIAQFKPLQFKLTIKDSLGNVIADEMLDFESDLSSFTLEEVEIEGYEFEGWSPELPSKMPAANLEIVGTYRALEKFKIIVLGTKDEVLVEVEVVENGEVPSITLPDLTGSNDFEFEGWDGEIPTTMPGANVTIRPVGSKRLNSINLYSADRTFISSIEAQIGSQLDLPTPSRLGYMFDSWTNASGQPVTLATMPEQSVDLFATWQAKVYDILVTVGPNEYNINITFGEPIGNLVQPQLFGFRFDGWKNEITGEFVNSNTIFQNPDQIKLVPVFTRLNAAEALVAITRSFIQFILRLFI